MRIFRSALALAVAGASALLGQSSWTQPYEPHHVVGNIYYVGSRGLAVYLIATPEGHILINSGLESTPPLIRASVEELGFKFSDVKILLISHAHWDHCAGSALVKELTGAKLMVMEQDVAVLESGGRQDFHYSNYAPSHFKPVKVDRALHDGDEVNLGGVTLTAHLTAGHTKGCTTWTTKVRDGAKNYDVVVVGSLGLNGVDDGKPFPFVNNALYPGIAEDFTRSFRVLNSLACDVFLGAHGDYYGMEKKAALIRPNGPNPFIDPDGYRAYVARWEKSFRAELDKQRR